mgnify:CR=1 FL=1
MPLCALCLLEQLALCLDGGDNMRTPQVESLPGMTPLGIKPSPIPARPLYIIAKDIVNDWHNINYSAKPYIEALSNLSSINDKYYQDNARSIVLYFLSNAKGWKGEKARTIKAELKDILKG